MDSNRLILAFILAFLIIGCALTNTSKEGPNYDFYEEFSPVPDSAPFRLVMSHESEVPSRNQRINLTLAIVNITNDTLRLNVKGALRVNYDFFITRLDSSLIFSLSHIKSPKGESLPVVEVKGSQSVILDPKGSREFVLPWSGLDIFRNPVKPGTYAIYAGISEITVLNSSWRDTLVVFPPLGIGPDTLMIR